MRRCFILTVFRTATCYLRQKQDWSNYELWIWVLTYYNSLYDYRKEITINPIFVCINKTCLRAFIENTEAMYLCLTFQVTIHFWGDSNSWKEQSIHEITVLWMENCFWDRCMWSYTIQKKLQFLSLICR